jgi:hypothetical protein
MALIIMAHVLSCFFKCVATSEKFIFYRICVFVRALIKNCFAMAEQNISYFLRRRYAIEFCVKFRKCGEELLEML